MRLNQLFSEADNDPYAKYWNPAEKEIEKQKAAHVADQQAFERAINYGKDEEQKAKQIENALVTQFGMDPDTSTLSRADKEPFETRQIKLKNGIYTVKAYSVDTYYGPETRAEFYAPDGKICDVQQEAMGVGGLIDMWREVGNHGPVRRRDETKF